MLAGAVWIVAVVEVLLLSDLPRSGVALLASGFMALPLAWRRSAPVVAGVTAVGAFAAQSLLGVPPNGQLVPTAVVLISSHGIGAYAAAPRTVAGLAAVIGLGLLTVPATPDGGGPADVAFVLLVVGSAWGVGRVIRSRTLEAHDLAGRAERAELESRERERQAIELERRRISREIHDSVAHSLSVMVLQAGAAEEILSTGPERAAAALRTIQDTGRQALDDMTRLMGMLRAPSPPDGLLGQPSLAELPVLVDQVRETGVTVAVTLEGDLAQLAPGLDLTAYRIVQEALTNVVKHAGRPAAADVSVRCDGAHLEVVVVDDGPGAGSGGGSGSGLVGMRERVDLFEGELTVGPRQDSGFEVRARLPVEPAHVGR